MHGDSLIAAVELATVALEAPDAPGIRRRLLSGLVNDVGYAAAVLWRNGPADHGASLVAHRGLTSDEVQALSQRSVVAGGSADRDATVLTGDAASGERRLHLVTVPDPVAGALGVVAREALGDRDLRMLTALARTYATAVRRSEALRDSQRVIDSMVSELRPGGVSLPDNYRIGHLYRSATAGVAIGGDLYDWFRTDRGHLGVAVGDVSGKGIQAASRTAMAVHSLRAFALPGASPHVAASMLNTIVAGQTSGESFVTLVYARVDPDDDTVEFVLAGHPPPVVIRRGCVEPLDVEADVPLGVDADATYALHTTQLAPGDALVLYTDGVTEARANDDDQGLLGVSGLVDLLEGRHDAAPQVIADHVWNGVQRFTDGTTADDCAVVVLRRTA